MDELQTTVETEEVIEARVRAIVSASATIPVYGLLAPSQTGTAKLVSSDTYIEVSADQTAQSYDRMTAPHTYSVEVKVRFAQCDDKSGSDFRDECRRVRAALRSATGSGCSAISSAGAFACDGFILDSTSTTFEDGDDPIFVKTYSATVKGRDTTTTAA